MEIVQNNRILSFGWSLINLENIFESLVAFITLNFAIISIYLYEYTIVSLKLLFASTFLTVCGVWAIVCIYSGRKNPDVPSNPLRGNLEFVSTLRFTEEDVTEIFDLTVGKFFGAINLAASFQRPIFTIKSIIAAVHLIIIGSYIPVEIILFLAIWFAFIAPTVYRLQKQKIDNIIGLISGRYNQYSGLIKSKIPAGLRSKLKID